MPAGNLGHGHPRHPAERGGLEPQPRSDPGRSHSHWRATPCRFNAPHRDCAIDDVTPRLQR